MYSARTNAVPERLIRPARRRLLLELRRVGVSAEQIAEFSGGGGWWPSIRDEPEFMNIRSHVDSIFTPYRSMERTRWADTQILIRLPDELEQSVGESHLDELPPWAVAGESYYRIYSVELSDSPGRNGGHLMVPDLHVKGGMRPVLANRGDVIEMTPDLPHCGSPNHSDRTRMALIFRLLAR